MLGSVEAVTLPQQPRAGDEHKRSPLVEFVDVQKTYDGETLVIRDLSLSIHHGEFLTLLGPSGSGKTTTLMMLAGFEQPTAGDIRLAGRSMAREPAYRRDLGVVFQDYALFPHMTVGENVGFPLSVRGLAKPDIEQRVSNALEMVELAGFRDRQPTQLSGGQQQRVALARALVFEPKLVLMDEPLGALDKQLREQMQLEIKHLQNELGVTVVYVTHDQSEALVMSDRIAVFHEGGVQQLGTPRELYEEPENAFVAQFIGENNQLTGRVTATTGNTCQVTLDGGGTVLAVPVRAPEAGGRTMVSVRPERVCLDPPRSFENRFQGRVEELIYLGDHTRIRVRLDGHNDDFVIKLPIEEDEHSIAQGQTISLGWQTRYCRALDIL